MANYWPIRRLKTPEHRRHVAERLLDLREVLRKEVTEKPGAGEFKVATWNLMHFGGKGSYRRQSESLLYIAQIIDHFDLVAIQEVKEDLDQLDDLVETYLGGSWDYIVSDTTEGDAGNDERMAVLYKKSCVEFDRLAGEIVLPAELAIANAAGLAEDSEFKDHRQLARTPYYLAFQAQWFKFKLCSVHIHYGDRSGRDREIRAAEIARLARLLTDRSDKERKREIAYLKALKWDTTPSTANYILLGDFNIHSGRNDIAKRALVENGFSVPHDIAALSTNTGREGHPFDQIAFRLNDDRFTQGAGGVFDFRPVVYRREDTEFYWKTLGIKSLVKRGNKPGNAAEDISDYLTTYYCRQQMSDHLLLWTSFRIDYAEDYLKTFLDD